MRPHVNKSSGKAGARPRLIAYVYFYFGRELIATAPLYSGEASGGDAPLLRAALRQEFQGATDISHKLRISTRVILPRRTLPHPVVYNGGKIPNSDNSGRKQSRQTAPHGADTDQWPPRDQTTAENAPESR